MNNRLDDGPGRLFIGLGLGMLIIFFCGTLGYTLGSESKNLGAFLTTSPSIGKQAPGFSLLDLSGNQQQLSDYIGKPILLNFWATWCGPCVAEMPYIQEQYEAHSDELTVIAISGEEEELTVREFVIEHELSFSVLLDTDGYVMDRYRITGYPTSIFIDGNGIIQAIKIGSMDRGELADLLLGIGVGQ